MTAWKIIFQDQNLLAERDPVTPIVYVSQQCEVATDRVPGGLVGIVSNT